MTRIELSDTQFWSLINALDVAKDKYRDTARYIRPHSTQLADQFQRQVIETSDLISYLMDRE
jgi:hypothetical protein